MATKRTSRQGKAQPAPTVEAVGAPAAQLPQTEGTVEQDIPPAPVRVGVLSDTHGYLDPAVLELFAGVDHIIHAGDIMDASILETLEQIAPVTAVCGNLDEGELAALPREVAGQVGDVTFAVGHKRKRLLKRLAAGKLEGCETPPRLIVCGHEHAPSAAWLDGTLHLNPGTASAPDEEDDAATVAIVESGGAGLRLCLIPLRRRAEPSA